MKRLMKKDLLTYMRCGGGLFLPLIILVGGLIYFVMYSDMESELLLITIRSSMMFSGSTIIAMAAAVLIQNSFAVEKNDRAITYLLANGFQPEKIWLSKLITGYILGYLSFLAVLLLNQAVMYVEFHKMIAYSAGEIILMCVVFPIVSFALVAIIWFVMWVTKGIGAMLLGFLPMFIYILSINLSVFLTEKEIKIDLLLVFVVMLISIVLTAVILSAIRKISFEYLANIHS